MPRHAEFEQSKHVYRNDTFVELVKDAIRFFNGTPVQPLPPTAPFVGAGVYALYYTGDYPHYKKYSVLNRLEYRYPIYVGKAVPKGWRQSRASSTGGKGNKELYRRLRKHASSIRSVSGLSLEDFTCRFAIFEGPSSDMVSTVEAALIKTMLPLWNSVVDGFGNNTPGSGRYDQAKSDWDVMHSGRSFAAKCKGKHNSLSSIEADIKAHLGSIR